MAILTSSSHTPPPSTELSTSPPPRLRNAVVTLILAASALVLVLTGSGADRGSGVEASAPQRNTAATATRGDDGEPAAQRSDKSVSARDAPSRRRRHPEYWDASSSFLPLILFVGTAHVSDLFKAHCYNLKAASADTSARQQQRKHNPHHDVECPAWESHILSSTITHPSPMTGEEKTLVVVAQFLYRPMGEPVHAADIDATLLSRLDLIVYGRGVLDLYHYNTPVDEFERQMEGSLLELHRLNATVLLAYAPHKVYPAADAASPSDGATRLFSVPSSVCVTIRRQKAYRAAVARAAAKAAGAGAAASLLSADSSPGRVQQAISLFDPWPLTTTAALRGAAERPNFLGHHYPLTVVRRLLAAVLTAAQSAAAGVATSPREGQAKTNASMQPPAAAVSSFRLARVTEVDPPQPRVAPDYEVARECDCRVYAPHWCELDRRLRQEGSRRRDFGTPEVVEFESRPERPSLFRDKAYSNAESQRRFGSTTCGGDGSDPSWQRHSWWRRRIDDRSPFKPTLYQLPCDDTTFTLQNAMATYTRPDLGDEVTKKLNPNLETAFRLEQCFWYVAASPKDAPYWFDAESCLATGWVRPVALGSSYEHYMHAALHGYLTSVFGEYRYQLSQFDVHKTYHADRTRRGSGSNDLVTAGKYQSKNITHDDLGVAELMESQAWTHLLIYRGGHDETFLGQHPHYTYRWTAREVAKIIDRHFPDGISVLGVLENAFWGRPPFESGEDVCMNPMRQDLFRSGMYCSFRYLQSLRPQAAVSVVDAFWVTSQDFVMDHGALPDGNHYVGVPGLLVYGNALRHMCGEVDIPRLEQRRRIVNDTGLPLVFAEWPRVAVQLNDTGGGEGMQVQEAGCDARAVGLHPNPIAYSQRVPALPPLCNLRDEAVLSLRDSRWKDIALCNCQANATACSGRRERDVLFALKESANQGKRVQGWQRRKRAS